MRVSDSIVGPFRGTPGTESEAPVFRAINEGR